MSSISLVNCLEQGIGNSAILCSESHKRDYIFEAQFHKHRNCPETHAHTYTHIHTHTCTFTHIHTYTTTHTHTHLRIHTLTHACKHTYTYTRILTHDCTHRDCTRILNTRLHTQRLRESDAYTETYILHAPKEEISKTTHIHIHTHTQAKYGGHLFNCGFSKNAELNPSWSKTPLLIHSH